MPLDNDELRRVLDETLISNLSAHPPLRIWSRAAAIYVMSKFKTPLSISEITTLIEHFTEDDYATVAKLLDSGIVDGAVTSSVR
jgi:hypothetical protein